MPRLILPSLQVNMRAGRLPPPDTSGMRFLNRPSREPNRSFKSDKAPPHANNVPDQSAPHTQGRDLGNRAKRQAAKFGRLDIVIVIPPATPPFGVLSRLITKGDTAVPICSRMFQCRVKAYSRDDQRESVGS